MYKTKGSRKIIRDNAQSNTSKMIGNLASNFKSWAKYNTYYVDMSFHLH